MELRASLQIRELIALPASDKSPFLHQRKMQDDKTFVRAASLSIIL
jgi:hypothetical protein